MKQRRGDVPGGRFEARIKIDWKGWKEVILRREDFKPVGKPVGWNWITQLYIRNLSDEFGGTLRLDDVRLVGKNALLPRHRRSGVGERFHPLPSDFGL